MRRSVSRIGSILFALGLVLAPAVAAQVSGEIRSAIGDIDTDEITADLEYLTSEELYGRHTAQPGQEKAAEYIAKQFEAAGLENVPGHEGWYHLWPMNVIDAVDEDCRLLVHPAQGEATSFEPRKDFIPVRISKDGTVEAPVVFVGYGIQSKKYRHDDYGRIDVRGKIALALWQEPGQDKRTRAFEGKELTQHSSFYTKAEVAQERGAVALMVVSGPLLYEDAPDAAPFELPTHNWPALRSKRNRINIPVVHVSRRVAEAILGQDLLELQKESDKRSKPFEVEGSQVELSIKTEATTRQVANVVGFRPGSDPELKDQVVVLGAHYDHMGMDFDGTGLINRGADDNASGTSALMAIARALGQEDIELQRSVLFIAFSGEEEGLLGSKAYCENPLLPHASCIAMLNMDMVGRNHPAELTIGEPDEHPLLRRSIQKANSVGGIRMKIEYGAQEFFNRSDQFYFHQAGIPAAFFFAGLHDDYHKPTDTADKIVEKKVQRVARLIAGTTIEIANSPASR
ncbi:MAG: M20/M25/M40 family metallo-hydrolase [Planctomycetota bacterium]